MPETTKQLTATSEGRRTIVWGLVSTLVIVVGGRVATRYVPGGEHWWPVAWLAWGLCWGRSQYWQGRLHGRRSRG